MRTSATGENVYGTWKLKVQENYGYAKTFAYVKMRSKIRSSGEMKLFSQLTIK